MTKQRTSARASKLHLTQFRQRRSVGRGL